MTVQQSSVQRVLVLEFEYKEWECLGILDEAENLVSTFMLTPRLLLLFHMTAGHRPNYYRLPC